MCVGGCREWEVFGCEDANASTSCACQLLRAAAAAPLRVDSCFVSVCACAVSFIHQTTTCTYFRQSAAGPEGHLCPPVGEFFIPRMKAARQHEHETRIRTLMGQVGGRIRQARPPGRTDPAATQERGARPRARSSRQARGARRRLQHYVGSDIQGKVLRGHRPMRGSLAI